MAKKQFDTLVNQMWIHKNFSGPIKLGHGLTLVYSHLHFSLCNTPLPNNRLTGQIFSNKGHQKAFKHQLTKKEAPLSRLQKAVSNQVTEQEGTNLDGQTILPHFKLHQAECLIQA